MKSLKITVQDISGIEGKFRPVTGVVPIAEGVAPEGSKFLLENESGSIVPLQTEVLANVSGFYSVETIRNLFIEKNVDGPNPYLCLDP